LKMSRKYLEKFRNLKFCVVGASPKKNFMESFEALS
jgi:hypothetical protein